MITTDIKKFEVIKFLLSTYSLPELDNDKDTIQCTKHNILSKELLKEFSNSLNKLEEDICTMNEYTYYEIHVRLDIIENK